MNYLEETTQVFRVYANRLTRGRGYFDEVLQSAQNIGLRVDYWIEENIGWDSTKGTLLAGE